MRQKIILQKSNTKVSIKKKSIIRSRIKVTKKKTEIFEKEIREYFDLNGFLTWSSTKKKYIISGTNNPRNGLVECPKCHLGKLMVIKSRKTKKRFMGCSNFHNGCEASSPLLQKAALRATKAPCAGCGWPIVVFRYSRKQKWIKKCSNIVCKLMPKS